MSFILNGYHFLFEELGDHRTSNFILVSNPFKVLAVIFLYINFVRKWGPKMMQNQKPFEMKTIMIFYNILQVVINVYLFIEGWRLGWGVGRAPNHMNRSCVPVDFSMSPSAIYVFMVLRKKNNQISYLHLYHHSGMIALTWAALRYYPGGHGTFLGFVNAFVHAVMYSYYLVALIKPPSKSGDIWWKKYLTILQMVQFVIVGFHQSLPIFVPNCDYPKMGAVILIPQTFYILKLFSQFYKKAYLSKQTTE